MRYTQFSVTLSACPIYIPFCPVFAVAGRSEMPSITMSCFLSDTVPMISIPLKLDVELIFATAPPSIHVPETGSSVSLTRYVPAGKTTRPPSSRAA